ncbi:phage tail length tape measure family protein [Rhizobium sp. P44RR-XXIV]|uniref:phage tail length tape measure family protein n=1 Tax=Rhizobium sp. P44RR-XXIV TaxID=1921145 RepID=UPI0009CA6F38|nr:phage tail length tape measure family protein [Rhizobium sp. P44RR-XXIV]
MADNDNNLVFTVSSDMSAATRGVNKFTGDIGAATDRISKKFEALGRSIDTGVSNSLQQRINSMVGIGTTASKEWTGALADQGKELDRLRAKYTPLFATVKQYQAAQTEIRTLYRSGKIGVDEYTAALGKERQATLASIAAIKGRNAAQNQSGGARSFQTANIAAQFQDVAVTSAMGMNPLQIALQQGTQLSMVMDQLKGEGKGTTGALLTAFGSLFSMTSLLTIGFVAVGAAAIQAVMKAIPQVKSLDDAMKDHEASLKRVVDAYGGVAEAAAKANRENKRLVDAVASKDNVALRVSTASEGNSFFQSKDVGRVVTGGRFGDRGSSFHAVVPQFQEDIAKLRKDFKAGKPDFDEFYESISKKVTADPSLGGAAVKVIAASEKFKEASDDLQEYQRVRDALFNDRGPDGQLLLSQGTTNAADRGNYALYQSQQAVALRRSTQAFYARLASEGAITTQQRVAAARGEAASQYNQDESPQQRSQRIDQAGIAAYVAANREIAAAARERKLTLDAAIVSQQEDIGLVGKTGAAAESLRREYQLTADLRSEAAKRGITDEKEFLKVYADQIALIKQNADEYGRLAEARARAQLGSDLAFQRDQLGRTPEQRSIAEQLKSAGLPVDLTSKSAKEIADTNKALAAERMRFAQEGVDAQISGINARSPAQRIAAARAAAEAQHNPGETDPERAQRINNAALLARVQISKELADADRERSLSLRKLVEDQQQDIAMIGKTGGAAAAATQQYQMMYALRAEAVKQGITSEDEFQKTFGKQIELIKSATTSYGQLVDARAKAQLTFDLAQRERTALMPTRDRQIVEMQRQYGQPEDPNSDTGRAIGKTIDAQANRDAVTGFLTEFKDGILKNSESIGKAFGTALENALMKQADKLWDNLFNQIAGALFPSTATNQAGTGGLATTGVGLAGNLLGGKSNTTNPVMAGNMSAYADAVKSIESGGNYGALGPLTKSGDRAYGAYQVMGANIPSWTKGATGTAMTPNAFLTDQKAQDAVFNKYFGSSVSKYGNPQDAASVWFSGRPMAKAGLASDGFNTTPEYVTKFNNALGDASKNVGTFGNGLGQIGQQLAGAGGGAFPAAPAASGGGGILGWIGSIFGGGKGTQWNLAAAGKLKPGLFADGGYTGPGGKNTPAGIVHAGEFVVPKHIVDKIGVPALSTMMKGYADGGLVTPALVSAPRAPALSARRGNAANDNTPGVLQVHINGASGDNHVRTLVKQGVGEGLTQYNDQQRRGGFGTLQSRFNNQKG